MKLIVETTGEVATFGSTYADFRGNPHVLKGGLPPRHDGSTGRIYTDKGEYFPSVVGLKWVEK